MTLPRRPEPPHRSDEFHGEIPAAVTQVGAACEIRVPLPNMHQGEKCHVLVEIVGDLVRAQVVPD